MAAMFTEKINEIVSIPEAGIPPGSATATVTSPGAYMKNLYRIRYNLLVGLTSLTITMALKQSAASNLSSPADIANTTITVAGSSTAGRIGCVELKPEMLTAGYAYVYASVTGAATSGTPVAVFVEGIAYSKPSSQFNDAVVLTQISTP